MDKEQLLALSQNHTVFLHYTRDDLLLLLRTLRLTEVSLDGVAYNKNARQEASFKTKLEECVLVKVYHENDGRSVCETLRNIGGEVAEFVCVSSTVIAPNYTGTLSVIEPEAAKDSYKLMTHTAASKSIYRRALSGLR